MGAPLIIGIAAGIGIVIIAVSIAYEIRDLDPEQVETIAKGGIGLTGILLAVAVLSVMKK